MGQTHLTVPPSSFLLPLAAVKNPKHPPELTDKPGTLCIQEKIPIAFGSLIRKPGQLQIHPHCISFSVFTYRSRKNPEDGVSNMHLGVYCINCIRLTLTSRVQVLLAAGLSSAVPYECITATASMKRSPPIYAECWLPGNNITTELANGLLTIPRWFAVRGEGLPHPQYYDVMYINHSVY